MPLSETPGADKAVDGVTVKEGEEGLLGFLARDLEVSKRVWDEHMAWCRAQVTQKLLHGSTPGNQQRNQARRSIFFMPVLSPTHPVAALWFSFMLLFDMVYTAFWVPLGVAFCTTGFGTIASGCTVADLLGGLVYAINLFMSFQTGLVLRHQYKRIKVTDGVRVARLYFSSSRFWFDLVALVPVAYLIVIIFIHAEDEHRTSWVNLLSLMRLGRLLRLVSLSRVVVNNTMSGRYQDIVSRYINVTTMYTLMLSYCLMVIINFEACIMLLIAYLEGLENSWLISVDWEDFTSVAPTYQWYAAIYWVITTSTTTGYGDFVAHSTVEQVFANIMMINGMLMFGLLVGTIANALTRASASAAQLYRFRKKMSAVDRWLVEHNVPERMQKQVKDYFSDVWVQRDDTSLDAEIFRDLPTALRAKVAQYVTMDHITKVHLLGSQEAGLQELLASCLRPVDVIAGHDICRQGEEGDRMWVCAGGKLMALQHQAEPSYLPTPCLLGESVLLGDEMPAFRARPWTFRALGPLNLWELRLTDLGPILRMYPRLKEDLLQYVQVHLLLELEGKDTAILGNAWCESVESITAALYKQPEEVRKLATEELRRARLEDGSLLALLDGLLYFSGTKAKRITLAPKPSAPAAGEPVLQTRGSNGLMEGGWLGVAQISVDDQGSSSKLPTPWGQHWNGSGGLSSNNQGCGTCTACSRSVCKACKQVVRPRPGAAQAVTLGDITEPGHARQAGGLNSPNPFLRHSAAASGPAGQGRTGSELLRSMGLASARAGGWRPAPGARSSAYATGHTGIGTVSMAMTGSLHAMSIPTENFGEGYGLWG